MKVIPAVDIRGGKVVRLIQGNIGLETIYSHSPLEEAQRWASYGIDMLHIVDLDGAIEGRLVNFDIVKEIVKKIKAKVELGGGIRDEDTIKMVLDGGIDKVVIGTKALDEKFLEKIEKKFRDNVVVGIDAKEGMVRTKGWLFNTRIRAVKLAKEMEFLGVRTINYTDISRDGTLEGPNIASLTELMKATKVDIIASGGVSCIKDVERLKALEKDGLKGMIIGKALYEKTVDLREAIEICRA
jgi:phosphoribosylformimino-5-aminoimidazole carboxamide ribotide isomerase